MSGIAGTTGNAHVADPTPQIRVEWKADEPGTEWSATFPDHPGFRLELYKRRKREMVHVGHGEREELRPGYVATLVNVDHRALPLTQSKRASPVFLDGYKKLPEAQACAIGLASTYIQGIAHASAIQANAADTTTRAQDRAIAVCIARLRSVCLLNGNDDEHQKRTVVYFKAMLASRAVEVEDLVARVSKAEDIDKEARNSYKTGHDTWERSPRSSQYRSVPDGTYDTHRSYQQSFYPGDDPVTYHERVTHTAYRSVRNPDYVEPPSLKSVMESGHSLKDASGALDAFLHPLLKDAEAVTSRALIYEHTVSTFMAREHKKAQDLLLQSAWDKLSPEEREALNPEASGPGFRPR